MSPTLKGTIAGLVAAICYGLIPLFTIPIKNGEAANHLSDCSIMFYRFALATLIIAVLMLITRPRFKITLD